MNEPLNVEYYREKLLALREALVAERQEGDAGSRTVELDQSRVGRLSRMDALQAQAMSVAAQERRTLHLRQIDAALQRIADEEFGDCLDCGEPIAPERLEFDPAAPLCIGCASAREE